MNTKGFRPPIAVLLAALAASALGALYFMPWLELSAEPQDEVQQGIYHFAPNVPPEVRSRLGKDVRAWPIATATPAHLATGRLEPYLDKHGVAAIQDSFPARRQWVLFCAVLPGVFLLTCIAALARLISKYRAGGYLAFGALVGIAVMTFATTVNFYEDLRGRVEQEGNIRAIRQDSQLAAMTGTFQSMQILGGSETFKTRTTGYFWVSMGLYALVLACGLSCRVPEDPPPTPLEIGNEGPLLRHRLTFAARGSAIPGIEEPKGPDFGPDLDDQPAARPPE